MLLRLLEFQQFEEVKSAWLMINKDSDQEEWSEILGC